MQSESLLELDDSSELDELTELDELIELDEFTELIELDDVVPLPPPQAANINVSTNAITIFMVTLYFVICSL